MPNSLAAWDLFPPACCNAAMILALSLSDSSNRRLVSGSGSDWLKFRSDAVITSSDVRKAANRITFSHVAGSLWGLLSQKHRAVFNPVPFYGHKGTKSNPTKILQPRLPLSTAVRK